MSVPKTIVVMPAYNAEQTLEKTIADIPFDYIDEIILVDDASHDNTVARAREIGAHHERLMLASDATNALNRPPQKILFTIARLPKNKGYGGNQKECYRLALNHGADIVVMLHPDYQYDPRLVKYFVEFIRDGYFDVMLGSRIRSRREALAGGMPWYKYYANRALSFLQNVASGMVLSEWHTGMRAYRREVLEAVPYQQFSDDFIFDTQVLFAIVKRGFSIGDIPVPVRYLPEASSINFRRSVRYGLLTVWETLKFLVTK
jgi:glycosyltransferase involved in cell wall biosynthesis